MNRDKGPPAQAEGTTARQQHKKFEGVIRILSLNVNGLRQKRKVDALAAFIASLQEQPDVCILTETHLLEHETKNFVLDTYKKAHESCREPTAEQACGGVLIMVKQHARYRKVNDMPTVALPLNGCSILVYLYAEDIPAIRITGLYLPPSAKPKVEDVAMLVNAGSAMTYRGGAVGHLIGGDLNHPSWESEYEEWIG